jgi:hypothetical protein
VLVVQVAVLGPVRAFRDGAPLALGAPKQRALLAALALHAGRPVHPDALIDLIWGGQAPPAPPWAGPPVDPVGRLPAGGHRGRPPWDAP